MSGAFPPTRWRLSDAEELPLVRSYWYTLHTLHKGNVNFIPLEDVRKLDQMYDFFDSHATKTPCYTFVCWDNHVRLVVKEGQNVYVINPASGVEDGKQDDSQIPEVWTKIWTEHSFTYVHRCVMQGPDDHSCVFHCIALSYMYIKYGLVGVTTSFVEQSIYDFVLEHYRLYLPPPKRSCTQ